jgi:AcrR family transcriptional regulator
MNNTNKSLTRNTEQKLINVATELFAKNGFAGTSTREICKNAGVNLSLISYHFGGKKELYEKIVAKIVGNIIRHMKSKMNFNELPLNFDFATKEQKTEMLFKALDIMIDYFYSDKISDAAIMLLFREQITSGVPINAEGYKVFKRLLASILDKDENDKEIIFRTLTIVGQVHSARIIKQFSLKMMDQSGYSKEDVQMLKQIIMAQTKSILKDLGAI